MHPFHPRPAPDVAVVAVVVIGHDDAAHVTDAVRSALAQGPAVREVVAVDDCSTDGSAGLLDRLAAEDPRVRVIRLPVNSGGCGTPRNTGLDAVTAPYVMFLDSDDVLPPGAVDALLTAAAGAGAQVTGGLCVRRELPSGREVPWEPDLYAAPAVLAHPAHRPRLIHDTLCVNKLYATAFLREHGIRFPEGRFPYEDIVFTARVWAAAPRVALVPDRVYLWHVRRAARRLSISLDRAGIGNWRARTHACRTAYAILLDAGEKRLARRARAKFLDHDLRMYARELPLRDEEYRSAWWAHTRAFLAEYDAADRSRDPVAPGPLIARVVLASPAPRDLPRLRELAARPARLTPPYARARDGAPCWSDDLPGLTLEALLTRPTARLPLAVDAELRPRARRLRLRLHDLYGRTAQAGPVEAEVEWRHRDGTGTTLCRTVPLRASAEGTWVAETPVRPERLAALGTGAWDLRLRLRFQDGSARTVTARALSGPGLLRRHALPSPRHGLVLVHPYATHSGSLALRVATGVRGTVPALRSGLRRLAGPAARHLPT
ncbi:MULTISPECIES: glycosyltransferase family 2 protein [unclassified Streptomyces]|uniref:glycosyltransferase family 2 protein n=1 Tax=unclassified Streptomyces TaxID=2593676 RepID=UPI000F7010C2|nr:MULTISPECIES: glycosyltransferase family 2 protein [unclassified Streptomyces]AZM64719.1 transferase [Streptomyces sp. WAC 01438]RSM93121.1 transferase [Streptomyces sp. WAC 01420]